MSYRLFKPFVLNGVAESGKNYLGEIVKDYFYNKEHVIHFSTIDIINQMLGRLGVNLKNKTNELRICQSTIKNTLELYDPDIINKQIIEDTIKYNYNITFIDCREPRNIKRIIELFAGRGVDCKSILVYRPNVIGKYQNSKDSLVNVLNFDYDYTFENNDIKDFKRDVLKFCEQIQKGE